MNELFESNGFIKQKDINKILIIRIDNEYYGFIFETNIIDSIPNTDIKFAIAVDENGKNYFFINKEFNPYHDETITSPNRTFYNGLMKEPFKNVYSLDTPIKIETDSNVVLEIQITNNIKSYLYKFSEELKDTYKTKEQLIESERKLHYDYLKDVPYCRHFNKEGVELYLENLNNCNSWEEIERVYNNQRPFNMEWE